MYSNSYKTKKRIPPFFSGILIVFIFFYTGPFQAEYGIDAPVPLSFLRREIHNTQGEYPDFRPHAHPAFQRALTEKHSMRLRSYQCSQVLHFSRLVQAGLYK